MSPRDFQWLLVLIALQTLLVFGILLVVFFLYVLVSGFMHAPIF